MEKKLEDIVSSLSQLTILEVKALVDELKDQWGVSDAVAVAPAAAAPAAAAEEEKTSFDVHLESVPDNKLKAIQEVRKFNKDLSLTDAKALVEKAPVALLSGLSKADAEAAQKAFEAAGVKVVLK